MLRHTLVLLAAAVLALPAVAQTCTQSRTINVAFVETSTGPYAPGDTYEVTLRLWADAAGDDMGVSTMVVDYNNAAMTYAAAPVNTVDYEWLRYQQFRPTIDGNTAAYTSDVRVTSPTRLTPFINLGFTSSPAGRAEAVPDAPTDVLRMRFTVVDPAAGFALTPRSQQFFNGPGGPDGCYDNGTFTGLEAGQQAVTGDAGWRMLAAPAGGLSVDALAAMNHLQGVPGYSPTAAPNLVAGYDGAAYGAPASASAAFAPGTGLLWYFYDASDFPGAPPAGFQALPMTLAHSGPAAANLVASTGSNQVSPNSVDVPLHSAGNGFNLIGNPFATAVDVTGIVAVGGTFASTVVQTWDDGPNGAGSYVLSTTTGDRMSGWQGFFLENQDATAAQFPSAARVFAAQPLVTRDGALADADADADADAGRDARHVIAFTLRGEAGGVAVEDRALALVLDPAAEAGWDAQDASKLAAPTAASVALAFVGERDGQTRLKAQEARPLADEGVRVALAVDAAGYSGPVTLSWDPAAFPGDTPAFLRDLASGETVDLRATSTHTFSVTASRPAGPGLVALGDALLPVAADRFELLVGQHPPVASSQGVPEVLALVAPSPNPFRDAARIGYALPHAGHVRVAVYDVLGREVAVLVDAERPAGRHEARLDGAALASGVYLVRLDVGDETLVRRMTRAQ